MTPVNTLGEGKHGSSAASLQVASGWFQPLVHVKDFWTKKRMLEISQALYIKIFSGGHRGGPCWRSDKAIIAYI